MSISTRHPLPLFSLGLTTLLTLSCGSPDGPRGGPVNPVGSFVENPDGGSFFVDAHEGGSTLELHIVEVTWGRIVDVHGLDASGFPAAEPVLREFVINENIASDTDNYELETDGVTQATRLVIQRQPEAPDTGSGTFEDLLRAAERNLGTVLAKGDGASVAGPFSFVARNATLVIRFDDLLDDRVLEELPEKVRVLVGAPPTLPFPARILFDPNHGGLAGGEFHSSRVLVDMTVSRLERESMAVPVVENGVGLPPSRSNAFGPSVSIRIPSRTDFGAGQFRVLQSLVGGELDLSGNGPIDFASSTVDVVRALRAGNEDDLSNGFLRDDRQPTVLADWPLSILLMLPDTMGLEERDFVGDVRFDSACRRAFRRGDVLSINGRFLEVREPSLPPSASGDVMGLRIRVLGRRPVFPAEIVGQSRLSTPFDTGGQVDLACWLGLLPSSSEVPGTEVSPGAGIRLSFSEPMDPMSLDGAQGLIVVQGDTSQLPTATERVVGSVVGSPDATTYTFLPRLPLDHVQGVAEVYTLRIGAEGAGDDRDVGATDLAGNPLFLKLPPVEFSLDPVVATARTGGIVLNFDATNEYDRNDPGPEGTSDLRGQVTYDLERGVLQPRQVLRRSWTIDADAGLPSLMFLLPIGFQTPLSPLGSKLQTLWRYADIGWSVTDESNYDLDVEGLAWKPFSGGVAAEFYEGFRISLAHSSRLPDETLAAPGVLMYPDSGLLDSPASFSANVLPDPESPQKVVHGRSLGYEVNPADVFLAANGSFMMPFPMNKSFGPHETFTWRDTSVLAKGGLQGGGIPLGIEAMVLPTAPSGSLAGPGAVPSYGLPLLMEFSCYPSNTGIGVNTFTLAVASLGQLKPNFRVHSTGGTNTSGIPKPVNPDAHEVPTGGFDPTSSPPGIETRSADPTLYFGQLDTVTRVSRAFTVWLDTESASPDYIDPLLRPEAAAQPLDTRIQLHYRGARAFSVTMDTELDATMLDAYGNIPMGSVDFVRPDGSWTDAIDDIDGARYIQVRITFTNNVLTGESPELDALSISYRR